MTETAEERRARKAQQRAENAAALRAELEADYLQPLPDDIDFHSCQLEHTRLRQKIMEFQHLVIQGKLDVKAAQDFEKEMVGKIHQIEEKARNFHTGGHVPKPGD